MDWKPSPNELVCCIDDADTNAFGIKEIERGRIYTVLEFVEADEFIAFFLGGRLDEPGIILKEVRRERVPDLGEVPFRISRFRPLDDSRLAVFRQHLALITRRHGVPA